MTREQAKEWAANFVADSKVQEAIIASVRRITTEVGATGHVDCELDIDVSIFKAHLARWKMDE